MVVVSKCVVAVAGLVISAWGDQSNVSSLLTDDICQSQHDLHCSGQDIKRIDGVRDHATCCNACKSTSGCKAWSWGWNYPEKWCTLKTGCDNKQQDPNVHSGVGDSPSPPPPPTPPSPPGPGGRKGSFLVIGDWGHDASSHGNVRTNALQRAIAQQMAEKMDELGDVKFVVNLGDSFYPAGVTSKSDSQWTTKFTNIYSSKLRSIPWYSVYGNHDNYNDRGCACGEVTGSQCAQVNSLFHMPSTNYYVDRSDLGIEIVAMDMNIVAEHPCTYAAAATCKSTCEHNLQTRANTGEALLKSRLSSSPRKNIVAFSHYPTDYFRSKQTGMLSALKDTRKKITYFGGHRHNTDQSSTASIAPNVNWLVGGCGGWGCDGGRQGFVVGIIGDEVTTSAVYANTALCHEMESEFRNASKEEYI